MPVRYTTAAVYVACAILVCTVVVQASVLEHRSVQAESPQALAEYIQQSLCQGLDPYTTCLYVHQLCTLLRSSAP